MSALVGQAFLSGTLRSLFDSTGVSPDSVEAAISAEQGGLQNKRSADDDLNAALGLVERSRIVRKPAQGSRPLFSREGRLEAPKRYPGVYDSSAAASNVVSSYVSGARVTLPPGSTTEQNNKWEEINLLPPPIAPTRQTERTVAISEFSAMSQLAFMGFKALNRIQSIVFNVAYSTNENMLVCAPTGAGKTNVALMTILHEIEKNTVDGIVQLDQFKIVYVAPMKALAAEMVDNFGKRLAPLGMSVRELTGDMSLTKTEIKKTQMLVTTPEKWDVITRKSTGDNDLAASVRLLILDEVHLLHDERGPVIESLVARTLRQVETTQTMTRIVGLSATLPNYIDVAHFLRVNPYIGLFYFDGAFRPVPLSQTYIGIKATNRMTHTRDMNDVCYTKVSENVLKGEQVMVFVHSRKETVNTARALIELALTNGDADHFDPTEMEGYAAAAKQVELSRNREVKELFARGMGCHHAGMLRPDRKLTERMFAAGFIKTLVCTATLAWGVNLPAHAVIIKGTNIYDAKAGGFRDLGVLDVQQIFGRAGRPQFDTQGEAFIITAHDKLYRYISLMTQQTPIESRFINNLADNLNAEICLGTVANLDEAVTWISYTYLFVRMRLNPMVYGITQSMLSNDPMLMNYRRDLAKQACAKLDSNQMVRFSPANGNVAPTDIGRTASHFYLRHESIEMYNKEFKPQMTEANILNLISNFVEFENIQVRDDELVELKKLHNECVMPVMGGAENKNGKANILLQSYISRLRPEAFSLVSDMSYVAQNAARVLRALFELAMRRSMPIASKLLVLSQSLDKRLWSYESPLRQMNTLNPQILTKIEDCELSVEDLREMPEGEIGDILHHPRIGSVVKNCVREFPYLNIEYKLQPITRTVLRVSLTIDADFRWKDQLHGGAQSWWIVVEDAGNEHYYHSEHFTLNKKQYKETHNIVFTVPVFDPMPPQYFVRAMSDYWIGSEMVLTMTLDHVVLPEKNPPHTPLLDLRPLPVTALQNPDYERMYPFQFFNPIQTQFFHAMYHTDTSALIGAPTGSGKTVAAELAIFRLFNTQPTAKVVYIAPLKALVTERIDNWGRRLVKNTGCKMVELTGDSAPDQRAIREAQLIVTTPEKWDGISRSWQSRGYVQDVRLIIIDEIHMLEADRGPVLEVIVSRTNFISAHTKKSIRVVGLSTALANAHDLGRWLGITSPAGLFNFRPSVRPVPLEVHIEGFPGKHYCPRMATMNKPAYVAIQNHSPEKPVIIFVSSRRQTRLTAMDLVKFCMADEKPKQYLWMPEDDILPYLDAIRDSNLRNVLAFGIGLHHAGLHPNDRRIVENLFEQRKIQCLVATSTLAWGVNLPAHLVIVKGTEYFDGKTKRYEDMAVTEILQMMGRAGRPQFDDSATACILVQDTKKHFYKRFLYEPFPVESNLLQVLPDHINAEIAAGNIKSLQGGIDYLTWTYFFQRVALNPSYYGLDGTEASDVNKFLSRLIDEVLTSLDEHGCVFVDPDDGTIMSTPAGQIASYYYIAHESVGLMADELTESSTVEDVLDTMTNVEEYAELPVRHNEDLINGEMAKECVVPVDMSQLDQPSVKANLLLQTRFSRGELPSTDYVTDTKTVLDQSIRILQAMIDISALQGHMSSALSTIKLMQMIIQSRWYSDSPLTMVDGIDQKTAASLEQKGLTIASLIEMAHKNKRDFYGALKKAGIGSGNKGNRVADGVLSLPLLRATACVRDNGTDGSSRHRVEETIPISVNMNVVNERRNKTAYAPNWGRDVPEDWFILIEHNRQLVALKRVSPRVKTAVVAAPIPKSILSTRTDSHAKDIDEVKYTVHIASACYLGLDQELPLVVTV
ncbi:activating signal cointegrator 1 complex subunit 3 [Sphaeroforma arctica JP610]|uniref:Activating signal cointegrator 1 complex subunit 3 n=1 Tax=Sphaeroforma arctica JP610 TaxID=667725 RepID=A0A0L0FW93_9EUKA|nr:activating signal cointegrator 1 complex subunit 3 [Sphaeroforma arctica JP610]KNC80924.1 activating signal cointegrator 1 complex subunit 3 [Sphaeroforma arctica JP610]|eukprot:XP_014154826.1 activating signal cointegrator 1 complex subunit 3 [Sphaeroforma arctica JP610]